MSSADIDMTLGDIAMPEVMRVHDGQLQVAWNDGRETRIAAKHLRQNCRCGECAAQRAGGGAVAAPQNVGVVNVSPCGAYAVRLWFSDGHSRGIFPFAYLRELGI